MHYPSASKNVIFDRSPVDYIAYSQYTANHGKTDIDNRFVDSMVPIVREALERLDLIVFLPITDQWQVSLEDDGIRPVDHAYRTEVDKLFKQIYRENRFDIMPIRDPPRLIELWGSPEARIEKLAAVIADTRLQ